MCDCGMDGDVYDNRTRSGKYVNQRPVYSDLDGSLDKPIPIWKIIPLKLKSCFRKKEKAK